MIILGIETSCDETSVSIIKASSDRIEVLSNIVSSQIKLHSEWGGVVPNLAAREHLKNISPVLKRALTCSKKNIKDIDLISVTKGPGLMPALLIGTSFAKTISYIWEKPLIGIHHIEGHIYANFIDSKLSARSLTKKNTVTIYKGRGSRIKFPILCLVVSGGHTQLILMKDHLQYKIIGETQDDAAGEAFDKVARILGLGYPGGPAISAEAEKSNRQISDLPLRQDSGEASKIQISLPRPMINSGDFNFSFSGLKTAVLYKTKKMSLSQISNLKSQICREFQQAVIDVLICKTVNAAEKYNPETIILAGGVSANKELQKQMASAIKDNLPHSKFKIPNSEFSLDNAAMIAAASYFRWKNMSEKQKKDSLKNWKTLQTEAGLKLS